MPLRAILVPGLLAILAGCSTHPYPAPGVGDEAMRADFPALLPTEQLRAAAATGPIVPREQAPSAQVDARAASLKARAARLRGDVIDAASKERLEDEITIQEEDV